MVLIKKKCTGQPVYESQSWRLVILTFFMDFLGPSMHIMW